MESNRQYYWAEAGGERLELRRPNLLFGDDDLQELADF